MTEEIFSPWSNFERMVGLHHWHGWRQGSTLFARPILGEKAQRLDLAAATAGGVVGILHPTLMPESGELDVFFTSAGSREVGLGRFPAASMEGPSRAPALLWTTAAPGQILAGRAALAPPSRGDGRHLALVMQEDDAVVVLHMDLGRGQGATTFSRAKIESAYPLPACNPGLHIDPEGVVHISLLLALEPGLRRIALATLTWEPEASAGQVALGEPIDLEAAPIAAALAYPVHTRAADTPVWVTLLESGELRSSLSAEAHRPEAPPALPMQVLNTGRGSFVLAYEAGRPVRFLPLY